MNPILRGAKRLTDFKGRDRRGEFWPFAGAVIGGWFLVYMVLSFMVTLWAMGQASEGRMFAMVFGFAAVAVLGLLCLLAAAVARRLHDVGRSSKWGLLPLGCVAVSLSVMGLLIMSAIKAGETQEVSVGFLIGMGVLAVSNLTYMVALVTLIVFLCLKSQLGENRWGPAPVTL